MRKTREFYVVVDAGGVSGRVPPTVCVSVAGSYGAAVPSTPVLGSGAGWPPPWAAGVCDSVCAGWVAAGGLFW